MQVLALDAPVVGRSRRAVRRLCRVCRQVWRGEPWRQSQPLAFVSSKARGLRTYTRSSSAFQRHSRLVGDGSMSGGRSHCINHGAISDALAARTIHEPIVGCQAARGHARRRGRRGQPRFVTGLFGRAHRRTSEPPEREQQVHEELWQGGKSRQRFLPRRIHPF